MHHDLCGRARQAIHGLMPACVSWETRAGFTTSAVSLLPASWRVVTSGSTGKWGWRWGFVLLRPFLSFSGLYSSAYSLSYVPRGCLLSSFSIPPHTFPPHTPQPLCPFHILHSLTQSLIPLSMFLHPYPHPHPSYTYTSHSATSLMNTPNPGVWQSD